MRLFVNEWRERTPELLNVNKPFLNSGVQKLGGIGHADFFHHIGTVCFHSLDADFEMVGDFPVFQTGPDQFQNLLFPVGEGFGAVPSRERPVSLGHRFHGLENRFHWHWHRPPGLRASRNTVQ